MIRSRFSAKREVFITSARKTPQQDFTRFVFMVVFAGLAGLWIPAIGNLRRQALAVCCFSNQPQVGVEGDTRHTVACP